MNQLQRLRSASARITLALCAAASLTAPASAALISYDFTYSQTSFDLSAGVGDFSGSFSVDNNTIVGISGSGGLIGTITGLLAAGSLGGNDNAFSATAPYVNGLGVAFSTSNLGNLNLFFDGFNQTDNVSNLIDRTGIGALSVTPSVVNPAPEPGALALTMLALAAAAATSSRRKASRAPATVG